MSLLNSFLTTIRSPRYTRYVFIALLFFLIPTLHMNQNSLTWSVLLSVASERPSPREAKVIVTGLSLLDSTAPNRVALCIVGHPRSFRKPVVHRSIKHRVIRVLRDAGYHVDIFLHLGRRDVPKNGTMEAARDGVYGAIRAMKPVSVSRYSNKASYEMPKCAPSRVPKPHALYRASECMKHVARRERKTGRTYDWIYKTRPDIAFGSNISLPSDLIPNTLYVNRHVPGTSTHSHNWLREKFPRTSWILREAVADHIWAASRGVANVVFQAERAFQNCDLYTLRGTINSEVGLTYWLTTNEVRYKTMPWFWLLIRDLEGPECFRVQWIERPGDVGNRNLTKICEDFRRTGDPQDLFL